MAVTELVDNVFRRVTWHAREEAGSDKGRVLLHGKKIRPRNAAMKFPELLEKRLRTTK
jgi:hypothetical protein